MGVVSPAGCSVTYFDALVMSGAVRVHSLALKSRKTLAYRFLPIAANPVNPASFLNHVATCRILALPKYRLLTHIIRTPAFVFEDSLL